jgi:hypothetical protein
VKDGAQMLLHRSSRTSTPNGTAAIPPPAGAPPDLSSRFSSCCARSSARADVCGDRRARLEERDLLVDGGHGAVQIRKMRAFASAATRAIRSGLRHPPPALSTATYKSRGAPCDAAAKPLPTARRAFHTHPPANMPQTAETASFKFNHTMLRVKDPKKSIAFYTEVCAGRDIRAGTQVFTRVLSDAWDGAHLRAAPERLHALLPRLLRPRAERGRARRLALLA